MNENLTFSEGALRMCVDVEKTAGAKQIWKKKFDKLPKSEQMLVCVWWLIRHNKHQDLLEEDLEYELGKVTALEEKFSLPLNQRVVLAGMVMNSGMGIIDDDGYITVRLPAAAEAQLLGFDRVLDRLGRNFTSTDVVAAGLEFARISRRRQQLSPEALLLLGEALMNEAKPQ